MTTLAWIYLVTGLVMAGIAVVGALGMRRMRGSLTRQSLPIFLAQVVMWSFFGFMFFNGVVLVMFLGTVAAVYLPTVTWMLGLPKSEPAPR